MLMLTVLYMKRDCIKTVTRNATLPVLIACSEELGEGLSTFRQELGTPHPVRNFRFEEIKEFREYLSEAEIPHFFAVIALKRAVKNRADTVNLEVGLERLRKSYESRRAKEDLSVYWQDDLPKGLSKLIGLPPKEALEHFLHLRPGPRAIEEPGWLLSYELSTELSAAQLVLWWNDGKLIPAIWCMTVKSALYVRALLDLGEGRGVRICPHCGDLFIQNRPDQDYCTVAHREAHRVARWRKQQKQKAAEKETKRRRDGTHQAR